VLQNDPKHIKKIIFSKKNFNFDSLRLQCLSVRLALRLRQRQKANTELKCLVNTNHVFFSHGSHSKTEVEPQFMKSNFYLLLLLFYMESDSIIQLNSGECLHCSREQWRLSLLFRPDWVQPSKIKKIYFLF